MCQRMPGFIIHCRATQLNSQGPDPAYRAGRFTTTPLRAMLEMQ